MSYIIIVVLWQYSP